MNKPLDAKLFSRLFDMNLRPSDWHKDAVIYQIYPRSFQDSNDDGVGDIPGITQRLDYLKNLGVDTIWLSPFFKSPMKDFGYDVSDYCDVDPLFGTLADFDHMVQQAHARGLRVVIDQVLSHTSDQHPWFVESRSSRNNPKAHWYVWADAQPDGSPPNNWLSIFGGSGWQWDTRRKQYYLHNFLAEQPDLNFHEPEVQDALLATMKFWLDRGVDGFRLDTVNYYFHSQGLENNPPNADMLARPALQRSHNVYDHQSHQFDKSQPENLVWLSRMRTLCNEYNAILLGEIGCDRQIERMLEYTSGSDRLHTAYSFALMASEFSADYIRNTVQPFVPKQHDTWPCWALANHDVKRLASRWTHSGEAPQAALEAFAVMQMTLPGTPCLYQGDELGLTEAELKFEDLVDPPGITFWPEYKGRDGCRTPMVWDSTDVQAGFSTVKPWLPVAPEHLPKAVKEQVNRTDSLLAFYQKLLRWRAANSVCRLGEFTFTGAHPQVLEYTKTLGDRVLTVQINLSEKPASLTTPKVGELVIGEASDVLQAWGYRLFCN